MILTAKDIENVSSGDRLIYAGCMGTVESDLSYRGGYKCGGSSIWYIFENYDVVEWIKYSL